jgi:hypothetical protein
MALIDLPGARRLLKKGSWYLVSPSCGSFFIAWLTRDYDIEFFLGHFCVAKEPVGIRKLLVHRRL